MFSIEDVYLNQFIYYNFRDISCIFSSSSFHLRNIKLALKTDLPNINGVMSCTQAELNVLDGVTAGTLTIQYGGGGAPANPDLEWEGEYILIRNVVVVDGGRLIHDCLWTPDPGTAADPAWTTVAA